MLAAGCEPLGKESVKLAKAGRRVLAEPLVSRIDAPRFDAAAMDGFAVRAADLANGVQVFRVVGSTYPGETHTVPMKPGQAVRIMTGGKMPVGTDRVIPWELVTPIGDSIEVRRGVPGRSHVRLRGSDLEAGAVVLQTGRVLDPNSLVVASAADVSTVDVWRQPKVHVISTGDELTASGTAAALLEKIPESLSEALLLFARQWGGKPLGATIAPDSHREIYNAARTACGDCDVLVMHGGASYGDRDFTKAALARLGLDIVFADVAMKPGKPAWYGRIGTIHVIGLPGNPTAAMTVARLFLAPLIATLGGRSFEDALRWSELPLSAPSPPTGAREAFLCAYQQRATVEILKSQSASSQLMLGATNALVRLPANAVSLDTGATVSVLRF